MSPSCSQSNVDNLSCIYIYIYIYIYIAYWPLRAWNGVGRTRPDALLLYCLVRRVKTSAERATQLNWTDEFRSVQLHRPMCIESAPTCNTNRRWSLVVAGSWNSKAGNDRHSSVLLRRSLLNLLHCLMHSERCKWTELNWAGQLLLNSCAGSP